MKDNQEWTIIISGGNGGFSGFLPSWFDNTYPFYGNDNHLSDMENTDLLDRNILRPGPKPVNLTAGSEAGAVTTTIVSILKTITSSDVTFAVGGAKLYKISATAVTNAGGYPMTIDKGTVTGEDATDLLYYKSNLYVFYNHSGSAGDIAKLTISTDTLDNDWGSTVATGAGTLVSAPHYAINGGDDVAYFTNGQYIGTIEGTTLNLQALDFWTDAQAVSVTWNLNRIIIAVNRPNITGSNFNQSSIYTWNGVSSSWEGDPIEVSGKIGALYTKNGRTFVWWQDSTSTGGYVFGYIGGGEIIPIKRYSGGLPNQAQVGEYEGHIAWLAGDNLLLWGAKDSNSHEAILFHYASALYSTTVGAFANSFGTPMIASHNATTGYSLAKLSGYTVTSSQKTKAFNVSGPGYKGQIDLIQIDTKQMSTGARADFTLTYDKGKSTKSLDSIAYSASNYTRHKILNKGPDIEDFRLDINHANGSETNAVEIVSIFIKGHYITNN